MSLVLQSGLSREMRQCAGDCLECYRICTETLSHCLRMGGKHTEPAHIQLLEDCIEICRTSAGFLLRGSELHSLTCGVCAEICDACARDCEGLGGDDMRACADACRRCADSCRRLSVS